MQKQKSDATIPTTDTGKPYIGPDVSIHEIGNTIYRVSCWYNPDAKETIMDKLVRLAINDEEFDKI